MKSFVRRGALRNSLSNRRPRWGKTRGNAAIGNDSRALPVFGLLITGPIAADLASGGAGALTVMETITAERDDIRFELSISAYFKIGKIAKNM